MVSPGAARTHRTPLVRKLLGTHPLNKSLDNITQVDVNNNNNNNNTCIHRANIDQV
jgi:hypothetical protein